MSTRIALATAVLAARARPRVVASTTRGLRGGGIR